MSPKKLLLIVVCVAVVISAYFIFRGHSAKTPAPKNDTIVAFGDSLVQGVGSTPGHDFVSQVSNDIGIPIINNGKSGDTTADALARIQDVLVQDPGIVILLLGGNDYLQHVPKDTTFGNLGKIVDAFKKNGTIVILLGVRGGLLKDTYIGDFDAFAKIQSLTYVPNVLYGLIGHDEFMSDEVHPNDAGYRRIANEVTPVVERVMGKNN